MPCMGPPRVCPRPIPGRSAKITDLVCLLRIGLQRVLGDLKPNKGVEDIAGVLRAGLDKDELHVDRTGGDSQGRLHPPENIE